MSSISSNRSSKLQSIIFTKIVGLLDCRRRAYCKDKSHNTFIELRARLARHGQADIFVGEKKERLYIVKRFCRPLQKEGYENNVHELAVLKHLAKHPCPFIVEIHTQFAYHGHLVQVMSWYPMSLSDRMQQARISQHEVLAYTAQLLSAVNFIHNQCIVHRDIKSQNVVIDASGMIKLIDFGLAVKLSECTNPREEIGHEMWSYAVVFRQIVASATQYRYDAFTTLDVIYGIFESFPAMMGAEAQDLVNQLMNERSSLKRPRSEEIMKHPFFKDINWDTITELEHDFQPTYEHVSSKHLSDVRLGNLCCCSFGIFNRHRRVYSRRDSELCFYNSDLDAVTSTLKLKDWEDLTGPFASDAN